MVAVTPPGYGNLSPQTVDAKLALYAKLCARDPKCSSRTDDLAETMRRVIDDMPRRWWFVPIDPGKVKVITFALLSESRSAGAAFDIFLDAEEGDASGLALLSLAYRIAPGANIWGYSFAMVSSRDFDPSLGYATATDPPGSILGSPVARLFWTAVEEAWPVTLIPAELRQMQPTNVETLLVSGSIDSPEPEKFDTALLPYLPNGRLVILREMGHTGDIFSIQTEALERLLTSFYLTGVADDSLYKYAPMDFAVSEENPLAQLGLRGIILIALGVICMIVLGIALLIRRVFRKP
jgi:hypothetical protein